MEPEKPFKDASPDEVREQTERKVREGVSRVAQGAQKASERLDQAREKAPEKMRRAGETTRDVGGTAVEEARKTREGVGGS